MSLWSPCACETGRGLSSLKVFILLLEKKVLSFMLFVFNQPFFFYLVFTFYVYCTKCIINNFCHFVTIAFMRSWLNCEVLATSVSHLCRKAHNIFITQNQGAWPSNEIMKWYSQSIQQCLYLTYTATSSEKREPEHFHHFVFIYFKRYVKKKRSTCKNRWRAE